MRLEVVDLARRWKRRVVSKWQHRNWIPAWTSPEEQSYLTDYTAQDYRGAGEIVDLGCLLGATTISLGKGLQSNASVSTKSGRIHAYDRFLWEDSFSALPGGFARHYEPGESILGEFESRTSAFAEFIKAYPGDITEIGWHGDPIEFLLVDANKSWELCEAIGKKFYPHLLVGNSFVFEQDFKHYYTPWVHILNYRLRSVLLPHSEMVGTCSVVFRPVKPVDPAAVPSVAEMKAVGKEELDDVYRLSLSLVRNGSAWERANVMASKVMFYMHNNRMAEAREVFEAVMVEGFTIDSDLKVCERLLAGAPKG
jgi:hypothetical protein